jgi:hypothetical protein
MFGFSSFSCVGGAVAELFGPGFPSFSCVGGAVAGLFGPGFPSFSDVGGAVAGFVGPVGVDGFCAVGLGSGFGNSEKVGLRVGD